MRRARAAAARAARAGHRRRAPRCGGRRGRRAREAIYHLAAQASVVASVQDPGRDCDVNVEGTLNVVEAAGAHGAPVVFTSTGGALYGDEAPRPDARGPHPGAALAVRRLEVGGARRTCSTWSLLRGHPARGRAARQRLRPAPEPARRGRRGGDLHRPPAHEGKAPKLYGHGTPDARLRVRRRRRRARCSPPPAARAPTTSPRASKPT